MRSRFFCWLWLGRLLVDEHHLLIPSEQGRTPKDDSSDIALFDLIEELRQVDINAPLAKLNEFSMSDNNGGRIEL